MGRYWNCDSGRSGKFGFATQSSGDPGEFFLMDEQEPTHITYYTEDKETVKAKLDEAYDFLGVPKEERIYYQPQDVARWDSERNTYIHDEEKVRECKLIDEKLTHINHTYVFEKVPDGTEGANYYCEEEGYSYKPKEKDSFLMMCRIWLGVAIYSDIEDDGYCTLEAEL